MISSHHRMKAYCSEPLENIENYQQAVEDNEHIWVCHHRAEILPCGRYTADQLKKHGLYWHRPASELIFLRPDVHTSLHHKGKIISGEHRRKIVEANPQKRKVKMTCIAGETVKVFDSFHDAERWLRANGFPKAAVGSIWKCCTGKRNRAYNARWSYAEEDE